VADGARQITAALAAPPLASAGRFVLATAGGSLLFLGVAAPTIGVRREHVLACAGLIAAGAMGPRARRLVAALAPFLVFGASYDLSRLAAPLAESIGVHVREPRDLDRALFGVTVDGRRVGPNEVFIDHHWPAVDLVCGLAYITYLAVPVALALYLAWQGPRPDAPERGLGERLGWTFLAVNVAGVLTYFLYPAAPPWYAAAHGFGPPRFPPTPGAGAAARWDQLTGVPYFAHFYARSANVFGAIPSLHVATPLLAFFYALPLGRPALSVGLAGFSLLVAFAAVYLQHHYVVDVLLGAAYAGTGVFIERHLHAARVARRRAAASAAAAAAAAGAPGAVAHGSGVG
jgi:inositol phosphorylceramide synthase catalytic subunit